jgi:hypothetical protein
MERDRSNLTCSTFLTNFSPLRLISAICIPLLLKEQVSHNYHDCATILPCLLNLHQEEEQLIRKMVPFADHLYILSKNIG